MLGDYITTVLGAGLITLELAAVSLAVSIVLGMVGAFCKLSSSATLRALCGAYTWAMRGVPDLVWMLLIFYSLPTLINQAFEAAGSDDTVEFSPFLAGALTLGLIFGAYMTETFRGALLAIPKGQIEAAHAYGLGRIRTFVAIILPQMARFALPGFTNNWLVLMKATALASLLGLRDIMMAARAAAEATAKPFTFYLLAGGFYLVLTFASVVVLGWIGRRHERGVRKLSP